MKRNVSLEEISDGKLYGFNDMVKADCGDCRGCSACCHGMGQSVILDPFDVFRLLQGMETMQEYEIPDFNSLMTVVELNVADGIILPNLKMSGNDESCVFLNEEGRCKIHAHRPGICRIFPLGRYYTEGSFKYFLQIHECRNDKRTKVKVKKWIDTPDVKSYETFINDWHYFLKEMEELVRSSVSDEKIREVNMDILNQFYVRLYQADQDFYEQFYERLGMMKKKYKK
ncbi:MAG: YkgJ family cysteine cluster protein [Lachnospiraceae bacterium]|nr:YkgJ family cysteine cluster protein [Lachnospiraceae bacterium]